MKKRFWFALTGLLIAGLSVAGFFGYTFSKTHSSITVEAGSIVTAESFIRGNVETIYFAEDCPAFDTRIPGRYVLKVTADGFTRNCVLNVEDTVAPAAKPVDILMSAGERYEAEDFVTEIQDVTQVSVSYQESPDFESYGQQEVKIVLQDAVGNETVVTSQLYIVKVKVNETYLWDVADGVPSADWFLVRDGDISYYGSGLEFVRFDEVGVYPVWLCADGYNCRVMMQIVDSKSPVLTVKEAQGYINHPIEASAFVDTATDETKLSFYYKTEPDWTLEGIQEVTVVAQDSGGNQTEMPAVLTLIPDMEAPIIVGAGNISVCLGENVSYRNGVSAYDACDGDVALNIDNSAVNLTQLGTYPVIYSATDMAGNTGSQEIKLTVMPERNESITLEMMYAEADKVLAEIITEGMTDYEKAEAIYNWTRYKIGWISDSQKENWVESAYDGFVYRKGDCYTYASVAKALLTRVGIANVDIWRNSTTSSHYWNLVDTGDGWYHFDATPRADKTIVFMWSESQLLADEAVRRSHVYDHSLFPTVNYE